MGSNEHFKSIINPGLHSLKFLKQRLKNKRDDTYLIEVAPTKDQSRPLNKMNGHYLELTAKFLRRYGNSDTKTILLTGTEPGAGTSTTAANFAIALAHDPQLNVLLVTNFRDPALQRIFKFDPSKGLSHPNLINTDFPKIFPLIGQQQSQILPTIDQLSDPIRFFKSDWFDKFLTPAQAEFDYIILDGPPILRVPESLFVSCKVDGVILVVEAGKTKKHLAQRAIQQIEDVGGKIIGVVLNRRKNYIPEWIYRHL